MTNQSERKFNIFWKILMAFIFTVLTLFIITMDNSVNVSTIDTVWTIPDHESGEKPIGVLILKDATIRFYRTDFNYDIDYVNKMVIYPNWVELTDRTETFSLRRDIDFEYWKVRK